MSTVKFFKNKQPILVTGGSGFIGRNFIQAFQEEFSNLIVNLDLLTYAGQKGVNNISRDHQYSFVEGCIGDAELISKLFHQYQFEAVINFAAETHVDKSIENPRLFLQSNIIGTFNMLEQSKLFWESLSESKKKNFRFVQISTDEVFGSLCINDPSFTEKSAYRPNSPYAASKSSGDHLARSYFKTFEFPTIVTNCSNNYGPFQFPEKLIPKMIINALNERELPIYGNGKQIRDWLHVRDHCKALVCILENGIPGSSYNIGADNEQTNLFIANKICSLLDDMAPRKIGKYSDLITHITDRLGHDVRYSVDATKLQKELGWSPEEDFLLELRNTIQWYVDNQEWSNHFNQV
mgnify:CR=1 FL=1